MGITTGGLFIYTSINNQVSFFVYIDKYIGWIQYFGSHIHKNKRRNLTLGNTKWVTYSKNTDLVISY